jgi:hypothetical protein
MSDTTPNGNRWARGLIGAFISGGAAAVTASATVIMTDPKDWSSFGQVIKLMTITFCVPGMISLFKYLAMHPLWDGVDDRKPGNGTP